MSVIRSVAKTVLLVAACYAFFVALAASLGTELGAGAGEPWSIGARGTPGALQPAADCEAVNLRKCAVLIF